MSNEYRKKPVVIEAFQMTKERRMDNSEWPDWLNIAWSLDMAKPGALFPDGYPNSPGNEELMIRTLEGVHRVTFGDWIIRGVHGELYPCKPDIFEKTYDPAHKERPRRPGDPVITAKDLDALERVASAIVAESPQRSEDLEQERDGAALSAGTPEPPASLAAEGGAGPYTMTENEQGYWRINGPTRVEGEWFRRADAESNLRIVNAAFAAGQASQPPVVDSGLSTKDVVTSGTHGAEGKVLTDEQAHYLFMGWLHVNNDAINDCITIHGAGADDLCKKAFLDAIAYVRDQGYLASQPLGEPVAWMSDGGEVIPGVAKAAWNKRKELESEANPGDYYTIPLYRSSKGEQDPKA